MSDHGACIAAAWQNVAENTTQPTDKSPAGGPDKSLVRQTEGGLSTVVFGLDSGVEDHNRSNSRVVRVSVD